MSLAKAVANAAAMLVLKAKNVAQVAEDTVLQNRVIAAATQCALSTSQLVACAKVRPERVGKIGLASWILPSCGELDGRQWPVGQLGRRSKEPPALLRQPDKPSQSRCPVPGCSPLPGPDVLCCRWSAPPSAPRCVRSS